MCGRFAKKSTQEVLVDWFGVELEDMPWFAPSFNVAPQSVQPVVRLSRDTGNREFALMRWGLVPAWVLLANPRTGFCKLLQTPFYQRCEAAAVIKMSLNERLGLLTGQSLLIFIQVVWSFRNSARILVRRLASRSRHWRFSPFGSDRRNISITCCVASKESMRPSRPLRTGDSGTLG
jgi:hypothetical protein